MLFTVVYSVFTNCGRSNVEDERCIQCAEGERERQVEGWSVRERTVIDKSEYVVSSVCIQRERKQSSDQ